MAPSAAGSMAVAPSTARPLAAASMVDSTAHRRPGSAAVTIAARRPGYRGAWGGGYGYGYRAPAITGIGGRWVGNRFWHPGYWGWRGGARLWIGPGWGVGFYPGCSWVQPGWVWNGYQWLWQEGYCAAY